MLFSRHTDYEAGRVAFFRGVVLRSDLVAREVATGSVPRQESTTPMA